MKTFIQVLPGIAIVILLFAGLVLMEEDPGLGLSMLFVLPSIILIETHILTEFLDMAEDVRDIKNMIYTQKNQITTTEINDYLKNTKTQMDQYLIKKVVEKNELDNIYEQEILETLKQINEKLDKQNKNNRPRKLQNKKTTQK